MVVVVGMKWEWSGLVALAKDVVVTPLDTGVNLAQCQTGSKNSIFLLNSIKSGQTPIIMFHELYKF